MLFATVKQLRDLSRSSMARSAGGVVLFTAAGQGVYLLAGPLIGRIFSAAEFGLYGLFYSFAVTVIGVVLLNFDLAIPAAEDDDEAHLITIGASAILFVLALAASALMAFLSFTSIFGFGQLSCYSAILLLPLLLAQGVVQLSQSWKVRKGDTLLIGKSVVTLNGVRGITQVGLGFFFPSWWSLIAGEIVGRIATAVHLMLHGPPNRQWATLPSTRAVGRALRRYREFATILLPAQFLDGIVLLGQFACLAYIYGPTALGVFFLMRRTLDMPVAFVFRSLSDVFYARLAHDARHSPEEVRPFFLRTAVALAGLGLLASIPFMIAAPTLFAVFFGAQWREAGVLAAIMVPAAVMNIAVAPVARIFALTNRPQLRFVFTISIAISTACSLIAAYSLSLDLRMVTILLSAAGFISYVVYFIAGYIASSNLRMAKESPSSA